MIRSMTGFGSYEGCDEICFQYWEIRSVNSKNFNVRFKIPSYLRSIEHIWLKEVKDSASRGNIDIYLNVKILKQEELPFSINESLLNVLFDYLDRFAKNRGEIFVPDYNRVLSLPSLWVETPISAETELVNRLSNGLRAALDNWNSFREREGEKLVYDLKQRVKRLKEIKTKIERLSHSLVQEKFEIFKNRIMELLKKAEIQLDEDRLFQELSVMADKLDISEELVRLNTHLDAIEGLITSQNSVGRTLDFLFQECFREINTCGNKAQSAQVSALVVEFKTELEKCREQVQNLE